MSHKPTSPTTHEQEVLQEMCQKPTSPTTHQQEVLQKTSQKPTSPTTHEQEVVEDVPKSKAEGLRGEKADAVKSFIRDLGTIPGDGLLVKCELLNFP